MDTPEIILGGYVLFGAVMGFVAARVRGWSPVVGIFAGLLLGVFSPLLFFVSGVFSGGVKCPACAEKVKKEAVLCRHCGTALSPR